MAAQDTAAAQQAVVVAEQVTDLHQVAQVNKVTEEALHQAAAELPAEQVVDLNMKPVETEHKAQDKAAQAQMDFKVTLQEPMIIMAVAAADRNPAQEMAKAKILAEAAMVEDTLAVAVQPDKKVW